MVEGAPDGTHGSVDVVVGFGDGAVGAPDPCTHDGTDEGPLAGTAETLSPGLRLDARGRQEEECNEEGGIS